ncbi:MAG: protein phosphatase CheZ [Acidobacteria bacterium]|nr:protein phosphatase CheZ [Acidobacteriota bacterium]
MAINQDISLQDEDLKRLGESVPAPTTGAPNEGGTPPLFTELRELARYLNQLLKTINSTELQKVSSQIPVVASHLSEVNRYTEEETLRILEHIDNSLQNHDMMAKALDAAKELLSQDSLDMSALIQRLAEASKLSGENKRILMDLNMALSFQDLAVQHILKIEQALHGVHARIHTMIISLDNSLPDNATSTPEIPAAADPAPPSPIGPLGRGTGLAQSMVDNMLEEWGR